MCFVSVYSVQNMDDSILGENNHFSTTVAPSAFDLLLVFQARLSLTLWRVSGEGLAVFMNCWPIRSYCWILRPWLQYVKLIQVQMVCLPAVLKFSSRENLEEQVTKKVVWMKTSACRDGTLKNQANKMETTPQHFHTKYAHQKALNMYIKPAK